MVSDGLIAWVCEGTKRSPRVVELVNQDPMVIQVFLKYLRSLGIDEKRLRGRLEIAVDEDQEKEMEKWSNITGIPKSQFTKPILKYHKGRRSTCSMVVRYSSAELQRRIIEEAKKFGYLSR